LATSPDASDDLVEPGPGSRGAVAIVVAILVPLNVIDNRVPHASLVLGPVGAAGLLLTARRTGLSLQELGLGPGTWKRGSIWALAEIAAVAAVFAIGAALPLTVAPSVTAATT
jgi:hypothetical protein